MGLSTSERPCRQTVMTLTLVKSQSRGIFQLSTAACWHPYFGYRQLVDFDAVLVWSCLSLLHQSLPLQKKPSSSFDQLNPECCHFYTFILRKSLIPKSWSTSIAYWYEFRLFFFYKLWNRWVWLQDNSFTLPSEHIDVLFTFMYSVNIMLLWSLLKNMTLVHIDNITSNKILIEFVNGNKNMTYICYLDRGALLNPTNSVKMRTWLCFQLQIIYKCSRHDILTTFNVNNEVAYLVIDRTSSIKDLMSFCVRELLVAEQFLNNKSYKISMFFGKVRIICFLNHDSISIICDVDLIPLKAVSYTHLTLPTKRIV